MNSYFFNFLGAFIGIIFIVWSIWLIYQYSNLPSTGKKFKKIELWIAILILLIGIADLSKALRDILKNF